MIYFEIFLLGFVFNFGVYLLFAIFYSVFFLYFRKPFVFLSLKSIVLKIKSQKAFLDLNKIKYKKQEDYVMFLPFGGGMYLIDLFMKGVMNGHDKIIFDILTETTERFDELINKEVKK